MDSDVAALALYSIVGAFMVALVSINGCTNEPVARHAAESSGLTEFKPTGFQWFTCGKGDWYHTGFAAVNVQGKPVSGVVCSGLWFKSSTVRFD